MDERFRAVATLAEALTVLEQAIAAKYTKPADGIPSTDMDADVQAALEKANTAVQSLADYYTKTEVDQLLAAINGMDYVDVSTLPTASASTMGKIYLVGPDGSGYYAYYYTSYDGTNYSWVGPLGTTEISLANYATKAELSQLDQELNGETAITISISQSTTSGTAIPSTPAHDLSAVMKAGKRYKITWTGLTSLVKKLTFYTRDSGDNSITSYWANGATPAASYSAQAATFDVVPTADVYKMRLYASASDVTGAGTIEITITNYITEEGLVARVEDMDDRLEVVEAAVAEIPQKVDIKLGKNILDPAAVTEGKYFSSDTGNLSNGTGWGYTDYIAIEGGKTYAATAMDNGEVRSFTNSNSAYYIFYDSSKTRISGIQSYAKTFDAPATAAFVRLSLRLSYTDFQLEQANARTEYEPYSPIGGYPAHIDDGAVSAAKLSASVQSSIYGTRGNYLYDVEDMLVDGESITVGSNRVKSYKRMAFSAKITTFDKLTLGHGATGTYLGSWVVIDGTNIVVHNYTSQDYTQTQAHGLTIGTTLQVEMEQGADAKLKIRLTSNGQTFEHTFNLWYGSAGDIYALSTGSTLTDAMLAWTCSMLDADIWVFGDSYLSLTDTARWSYYLIDGDHSKFLINAQSGGKSAGAFTDLQALLQMGTPKKLVWAMGMNDPDSDNAVNSAWKSAYDSVVAICSEANIELIVTTIPTVSGGTVDDSDVPAALRVQKYKNAIIRASGLRYIDFDAAVNADEDTGQWYAGMLSSDGVHPTIAGALTLYHAAVATVPELLNP